MHTPHVVYVVVVAPTVLDVEVDPVRLVPWTVHFASDWAVQSELGSWPDRPELPSRERA